MCTNRLPSKACVPARSISVGKNCIIYQGKSAVCWSALWLECDSWSQSFWMDQIGGGQPCAREPPICLPNSPEPSASDWKWSAPQCGCRVKAQASNLDPHSTLSIFFQSKLWFIHRIFSLNMVPEIYKYTLNIKWSQCNSFWILVEYTNLLSSNENKSLFLL